MQDLCSQNVVFLDFQTSGLAIAKSHIIEMGLCLYKSKNNHPLSKIHTYLIRLPEEAAPLSSRVENLTGITNDLLQKKGLDLTKTFDKWRHQIEGLPFVIHFARFEKPFLKNLLGDNLPPIICTYEITKRLYPQLPSKSLRSISGYLGLPIAELKRSHHHLEASIFIWEKMLPKLKELGLHSYQDVISWIKSEKAPKKPRSFAISQEKRLSLPKTSGIYKMLDQRGSILYIGKAKNLRSRVSSYFTGKKTKGSRLNEMLSQVKDLKFTTTISACQAALLEVESIQKYNPPYNLALRSNKDHCFFLDELNNQTISYGPFRSSSYIEYFKALIALILENKDHELRLNPLPKETLLAGVELFKSTHRTRKGSLNWRRIIIKMWFHKLAMKRLAHENAKKDQSEFEDDLLEEGELKNAEEQGIVEITKEDVCHHIENFLAGLGQRIHRGRWLVRFLHCSIEITHKNLKDKEYISVKKGKVEFSGTKSTGSTTPRLSKAEKQALFDQKTYDRMSVLLIELKRLTREGCKVDICFSGTHSLDTKGLGTYIFPETPFAND